MGNFVQIRRRQMFSSEIHDTVKCGEHIRRLAVKCGEYIRRFSPRDFFFRYWCLKNRPYLAVICFVGYGIYYGFIFKSFIVRDIRVFYRKRALLLLSFPVDFVVFEWWILQICWLSKSKTSNIYLFLNVCIS